MKLNAGASREETRVKPRTGRWTHAERRAQVAEITLDLVARYGVEGATVGRIAEAAGISPPALYNHFSGRTELLEAALTVLLTRVLAWLDSSSNPNMLERLRELVGPAHKANVASDPYRIVLPLFEFAVSTAHSRAANLMAEGQAVVLKRFVDIIEEGKTQGTIRNDVDSEVVAWSLIGVGWTADFASLQGLDQFTDRGIAGKMLESILAGLAVR